MSEEISSLPRRASIDTPSPSGVTCGLIGFAAIAILRAGGGCSALAPHVHGDMDDHHVTEVLVTLHGQHPLELRLSVIAADSSKPFLTTAKSSMMTGSGAIF